MTGRRPCEYPRRSPRAAPKLYRHRNQASDRDSTLTSLRAPHEEAQVLPARLGVLFTMCQKQTPACPFQPWQAHRPVSTSFPADPRLLAHHLLFPCFSRLDAPGG